MNREVDAEGAAISQIRARFAVGSDSVEAEGEEQFVTHALKEFMVMRDDYYNRLELESYERERTSRIGRAISDLRALFPDALQRNVR